ncbi:MAG: CrcB family protein [Deltaproteobacteria bacterium]|nr:CrcB family protein [Deltaproteobacteria bacterium]
MKILWMALAGVGGTLLRYWLSAAVQRISGGVFPWGTFAVNMIGCLFFGFIWSMAEERLMITGETRAIVLVGFMGAFTTFSSFIFETNQLLRDSQWALAFGNIALQNISGIIFLMIGLAVGRLL